MKINKDTLLFGSFSKNPGNVGCKIFNTCFEYHDINAIYKSFSVENIKDALISAKCLNFSGFAISMPFKTEVIQYLDIKDSIVQKTNSCNTVIIKENKLIGYNTDYFAIYDYLKSNTNVKDKIIILGNGSYSKNVQLCCKELLINFEIIIREDWCKIKDIKNSVIFNCTPVENIEIDSSNYYIDCINTSKTGLELSKKQAALQYKLYVNKELPLK
mgnify:CR=1 FL=1